MASAENDIKRAVLDLCKRLGIPATRHQSGAVLVGGHKVVMGEAGWPDIIGVLPDGRFLGIECKTVTGRVEDTQIDRLMRLSECGAVVLVTRDIDEIARDLRDLLTAIRAR